MNYELDERMPDINNNTLIIIHSFLYRHKVVTSEMMYESRTVAYHCNTFLDIMFTGPSVMDVDIKICEGLNGFIIVPGHRHL